MHKKIHWQGLTADFDSITKVVAAMNHTLEELVDTKYKLTSAKEMLPTDLNLAVQQRLLKLLKAYHHNLFSEKVRIPPYKPLLN